MSTNLRKFATLAAYQTEVDNNTLVCPNVSLIQESGAIKYLQKNPPIGIGIKAIINSVPYYYTLDEYNALETKPTAQQIVGVYLKSPDTGFVIHSTINNSVKWSDNTIVVVPNVTTTTTQSVALMDYAGLANTEAVLNAIEQETIANGPIFTWARGLSFVGGASGYVPAMGQLNLIRENLVAINACRTAVGHNAIVFEAKNIWTSTQRTESHSWFWYSTYWANSGKTSSYVGLAVCAL